MNDLEQKRAYKEVLTILDELNLKECLPNELVEMMQKEQDENWKFSFHVDLPLEKQKILKSSAKLLSVIYIAYICEDDNEKKELKAIYEETERKSYDLFKEKNFIKEKNNTTSGPQKQNISNELVCKKMSLFEKIKILLRNILKI